MQKNVKTMAAKYIKVTLEAVLKAEANTASCGIMYQPKEPKELARYRRNKC